MCTLLHGHIMSCMLPRIMHQMKISAMRECFNQDFIFYVYMAFWKYKYETYPVNGIK